MPDWFYQPIYKPIVMRFLRAEQARQLTLFAMQQQSRLAIGRFIFNILAKTQTPIIIPNSCQVELFGLRFPSPVGMAQGIAIEANALPLWSMLGLGFIQIGALAAKEIPSELETEPRLLGEIQGILTSQNAASPSPTLILERLRAFHDRTIPMGIALREDALQALPIFEADADFFSIPSRLAQNLVTLKAIRVLTSKPLLLRLVLGQDAPSLEQALENAILAGFNGAIVLDGEESPILEEGILHGAHLRKTALEWVAKISSRYGENFPVIASGGIMTPSDALAFLQAGAKLVQIYEGFIYAGPGLPRRIIGEILNPSASENLANEAETPSFAASTSYTLGWKLLAFVGIMLILSGLFGMAVAFTVHLLPYEWDYLKLSFTELQSYYDGRLLGFIFHDRIIYNGAILTQGILYTWLALVPLHPTRRAAWAWWALAISGFVGASSSLISYLYSNYLDLWYGSATLFLVSVFTLGLILTYRYLSTPRHIGVLWRAGAQAWVWSPAGIGRLYLLFWAFTTALGGFLIFSTGMSAIFVPEDLEFMRTTVDAIGQISPQLIPFIAHDRIGFGVNLFAIGFVAFVLVWKAVRPNAKSLFVALALAYFVSDLTAVWIHPLVGYNSFSHLLPFIAKDIAFLMAILYLYRPVLETKPTNQVFPDL